MAIIEFATANPRYLSHVATKLIYIDNVDSILLFIVLKLVRSKSLPRQCGEPGIIFVVLINFLSQWSALDHSAIAKYFVISTSTVTSQLETTTICRTGSVCSTVVEHTPHDL